MRLIELRLCHVLLITSILYTTEGIETGCDDWKLSGTDEVCCLQCSPGNRLVARCGRDPTKLCTPCEPDTYTVKALAPSCNRCTQCIDPQVQLKACNASADTVCGCKPGLLCGNEQCSYCVEECREGQEPTEKWTCRKCREGTFNDKMHSSCKPWSRSCPEGENLIAKGNEFSDIKCSRMPETTNLTPKEFNTLETLLVRKEKDNKTFWPLIGIVGGISALLIILILLLWFASQRTKNKSKRKEPQPETLTQGELIVMMVEHEEACSFHRPEQEQGGSSESISTQDSEIKLIV